MTLRTKLSLICYFGFILLVVVGLWWFRFVWLTTYSTKAYVSTVATFRASDWLAELKLETPRGKPVLAHFVDPDCPCSRFSVPYIEKLRQAYAGATAHILVDAREDFGEYAVAVKKLMYIVPASPAVAIWNDVGELVYFGTYSTGAYCGDGEDLVVYILEALAKGEKPHWINQEAQGCMCAWPFKNDT